MIVDSTYSITLQHTIEYVETENGKHKHVCSFCKYIIQEEHYYCYINGVLQCSDEPIVISDPGDHLDGSGSVFISGDVTNDGQVNISDAVMFKRYFLGAKTLASWNNADLNKDGNINIFDYVMLKNQLLNSF